MLENSPDQNIVEGFYISKEYFLFRKLVKYFNVHPLSNAYSQVENKPLFPVNLSYLNHHYLSCCNPKRLTLDSCDNCKKLLNNDIL